MSKASLNTDKFGDLDFFGSFSSFFLSRLALNRALHCIQRIIHTKRERHVHV